MSRNIKFTISYNGKAYHGFQIQPNAVTIQGEIENTLYRLLNEKITITGCSRTDAGVHAKEFVFNAVINNPIPESGLKTALNALLPKDIAVISCAEVDKAFHARYDTVEKEYLYLVYVGQRDVFSDGLALNYGGAHILCAETLHKAAQLFVGEHDFSAFCKAEAKEHLKSTVREIKHFNVIQNGKYTEFYVSGTGFLHNMVRIMTGTLIYVAEQKRTEQDIITALNTGNREKAGITLPPDGLYLNRVVY